MDTKKLCDLIDKRQGELYDLLVKLVNINSESFGVTGNEKECAEYIHKLCKELGLESELYSPLDIEDFENHPDYFPGRNLENRLNVTARWRGKTDVDSLMLMGHTDTVEIGNLANWHVDPLKGEIRDGRLYGRGACDDKYALATTLFLIKLLKDEGFTPKENLVFSAYSDEEQGGSHGAIATCIKYPCKHLVNLDGMCDEIWHCASGGGVVIYRYHVKDTVDSAQRAASAIPVVLAELEKFSQNRKAELEENRFYKGTNIPDTSFRYMEVRAGNNGLDLGTGEIDFIYYTDKTKEEIQAEFKALEESIDKKLEPLGMKGDGFTLSSRFFHYGYCEPDCEDIKMLIDASKEVTGRELKVCGSCLSDLSAILKYGPRDSFSYGVARDFSEEGGAHQPNEFIELDKLLEFTKIIGAYILKVLS